MAEILFIKMIDSSFVVNDEKILKQYFSVDSHLFIAGNFIRLFLSEIKLMIWLIKRVKSAQIIYIWFADYHSLLPVIFARIFRKKTLIIVGGYEVAKLPALNYGAQLLPFRAFVVRRSLHWATIALPVSNFTHSSLQQFVPKVNAKVIYNGVNSQFFKQDPRIKKQSLVLTVCGASDRRTIKLKGIDLFIATANLLPQVRFLIVGLEADAKGYVSELIQSDNIEIRGRCSPELLVTLYSQARVYCQFSLQESFCMALAEAMSCGCIPVVTDAGALPELVGNTGLIVKQRQPEQLSQAIQQALSLPQSWRKKVEQRVNMLFSLQQRENELLSTIKSL